SYPPSSRNDPEKEKNYCPHHFSKVSQYENIIIQKNRGFIAYSAIKMPAKPPRRNPLRTAAKLSPMIGKILL
ncbi:hypothetical protein, partial [Alloprevotella tannerae]|uniref:hypothetical protein n=1 Tax=Alloprevotella tannerae TaxID=76122 RepID=UPI001EDBC2F7